MRFKVGYQVGLQDEVYIDIPDQTPGHMVFVGQTGCGKTTSLEAFVSQLVNQNKTVIVFRTQADEVGFVKSSTPIDPYFGLPSEGITSGFLQAVIEAHTGKSAGRHQGDLVDLTFSPDALNNVKRPDSINAILLEVRRRRELAEIEELAASNKGKKGGRALVVRWKVLESYFVDIMKELGNIKPYFPVPLDSHSPGIYLCDLTKYGKAVQALVMVAYLEKVMSDMTDTIVVIPEAWELIPHGKTTPVKAALEKLVKQGRKRNNWIWLDTQRIIGMDKHIRTQFHIWFCGLQTDLGDRNNLSNQFRGIPNAALAELPPWEFFLYNANEPANHRLKTVLVEEIGGWSVKRFGLTARQRIATLVPLLDTREFDELVERLAREGKGDIEIGRQLGVPPDRIATRRKRLAIPSGTVQGRVGHGWQAGAAASQERLDTAIRQYVCGVLAKDIRGVSINALYRALKDQGIPLRGRGRSGSKQSVETKQKISAKAKGRKASEEGKRHMSEAAAEAASRRWGTAARDSVIADLLDGGCTVPQIATKLGVTPQTVYKAKDRLIASGRIKPSMTGRRREEVAKRDLAIAALLDQRYMPQKVAEQLSMTRKMVYNAMERLRRPARNSS